MPQRPDTAMDVAAKRAIALLLSAAFSAIAIYLFVRFVAYENNEALDYLRTLLIGVSTFWLTWSSASASFGLFANKEAQAPAVLTSSGESRIVVLVPVYNEDPAATLSRVAAMDASLSALDAEEQVHFAILSDTNKPEIAADEEFWFARLVDERAGFGRMFYRRRPKNIGKKAGNIEDFIARAGGAYDFALILDADSLLEGETILEMARRMEANPSLALLQSLPTIIHARSFFGRSMQFCSNYFSPLFARGVAALQGREGPFWGHNAMVRVQAFAASCGLPELSGKPPFGGHILSHDYVEAALLARAGWTVRLDTDLKGSYEEGPENLIEYAKRDRRWCQGNLQHGRLVLAPGLRWWSRVIFLQGIMAYVASPIWLLFLATSIAAAALTPNMLYPGFYLLPPYYYETSAWAGVTLLAGILTLLILPKLLIVLRGTLTGDNRQFGGNLRVFVAVMVEIFFSSMIAPIMLALQSRAVIQVLLGLDGGWPATRRSEGRLTPAQAWSASAWIALLGLLALALAWQWAPEIAVWVMPVGLPMLLSPIVIWLSSISPAAPPPHFLFATPSEIRPSPVIVERDRILSLWSGTNSVLEQTSDAIAKEGLLHADL